MESVHSVAALGLLVQAQPASEVGVDIIMTNIGDWSLLSVQNNKLEARS